MNHSFNVNIASEFSVDTALFLGHLEHWTFKNLANKKNIHDGYCWSYDTIEALGDIFPYWSKGQRERVINNAVAQGLVIRGNYNQTKYDRTVWYALTYKAYTYFEHLLNEKYLQALWLSISRNQEMDFPEWRNGFPGIRKPIPDTNPVTDPKECGEDSSAHNIKNFPTPKELNEKSAYESEELKKYFNTKFAGLVVTYDKIFNECKEHYESKQQWVTCKKWKLWIEREKLENYSKTNAQSKKAPLNETEEQRKERQFFQYELSKEREKPGYISKALQDFPQMRAKYS